MATTGKDDSEKKTTEKQVEDSELQKPAPEEGTAETPKSSEEPTLEDLFSEAAEGESEAPPSAEADAPVESEAETEAPSEEPTLEDLFSEAAESESEVPPSAEAAAPAESIAETEAPSEEPTLEDLFSEAAESESEAPPSAEADAPVESEVETEAPSEEPTLEDPFSEAVEGESEVPSAEAAAPAESVAETEASAEEPTLEDLFNEAAEGESEVPSAEAAAPEEPTLDDLFGHSASEEPNEEPTVGEDAGQNNAEEATTVMPDLRAAAQNLLSPQAEAEFLAWRWAEFEIYIITPHIPDIIPPLILGPEKLIEGDGVEFVYNILDHGSKLATSKGEDMFIRGMSMCKLYYTIEKMVFLLIERLKSSGISTEAEVEVAFAGHIGAQRKGFESIVNLSYNVVVTNFEPGAWGEKFLSLIKHLADKGYGYPPESPRDVYRHVPPSQGASARKP